MTKEMQLQIEILVHLKAILNALIDTHFENMSSDEKKEYEQKLNKIMNEEKQILNKEFGK